MDLSIIVPVYNVEKYIRPCFESIFKQGLDDADFEVIIVNDGSTDNSMEMITDIVQQHNNITVINQENLSLSVARNKGIAVAKGEYILMPDSDDLLIENSLKPLLGKALESKPDLVVADFLIMTNDEIEHTNATLLQKTELKYIEKTGEELFLHDLNPYQCYVWRTLFRREFLLNNNLTFVPGIRYQDVPFTHECYLKARKCFRVSWLLNIYRKRPGATTSFFDYSKAKDFCKAIAITWDLRRINGLSFAQLYKLEEDVYVSFHVLTYLTIFGIREKKERKKIFYFLKSVAPHLFFSHGIKQKMISFIYQRMPYIYIEFYYIIYRKVFRYFR